MKVLSVEPDGVTYMHASGIAMIPFTELPEAIRQQYGYDPKRAASYTAQDDAAQARLAAEAAENRAYEAAVIRARQQGKPPPKPPVRSNSATGTGAAEPRATGSNRPTMMSGRVERKLQDGIIVECRSIAPVASGLASIGGGGGVAYPQWRSSDIYGRFFLIGHLQEATLADGDHVDVNVTAEGTKQIGISTLRSYRVIP